MEVTIDSEKNILLYGYKAVNKKTICKRLWDKSFIAK